MTSIEDTLVIGLTCDYSPVGEERAFSQGYDLFYLNCDYMRPLEKLGAVPVIFPSVKELSLVPGYLRAIDGLLLTGGDDVAPEAYGEQQLCSEWKTDRDRTVFETKLIRQARLLGMPIFGICRGCESLNVALGGSLYQDIASMIDGALTHRGTGAGHRATHEVRIEPTSKLAEIVGETNLVVNSYHHQAVKNIGRDLVVSARAADGVVEALEAPNDFFTLAVQWHPERMQDDDKQLRLFEAFLEAVNHKKSVER